MYMEKIKRIVDRFRPTPRFSDYSIRSQEEFVDLVKQELDRTIRSGQMFSILEYRHSDLSGSADLPKELCRILAMRLRSTDEVGWCGKKAIGCLLVDADQTAAMRVARDISLHLSQLHLWNWTVYTYPLPDSDKRGMDLKTHFLDWVPEGKAGGSPDTIESIYRFHPLHRSVMPFWKRGLDIVLGTLFLLLLFLPMLLMILWIKTVSSGPVFFRQTRVGFGGILYTMYKLRTMYQDVDSTQHKNYLKELISTSYSLGEKHLPMDKLDGQHDERILPGCGVLRRIGLDELPQLFHVLQGRMSLVGPRPAIPYEVEDYAEWHTGRFRAIPGLTGLWQVKGKNSLTFREMISLDIRYSRQISFVEDLKILGLTPLVMLKGAFAGDYT